MKIVGDVFDTRLFLTRVKKTRLCGRPFRTELRLKLRLRNRHVSLNRRAQLYDHNVLFTAEIDAIGSRLRRVRVLPCLLTRRAGLNIPEGLLEEARGAETAVGTGVEGTVVTPCKNVWMI